MKNALYAIGVTFVAATPAFTSNDSGWLNIAILVGLTAWLALSYWPRRFKA